MISKIKENLKAITASKGKIKLYFLKENGGKTVLNLKRISFFGGPILFLLIVTTIVISNSEDSSFLGKSDRKIIADDTKSSLEVNDAKNFSPTASKVLGNYDKTMNKPEKRNGTGSITKIIFKAQQVISRDGSADPSRSIPMGTNMIGKLLTTIDTRNPNQIVKILLPYGARSKMGVQLERGTTLFGQVNYPGKGRKVFISINKGLTPNEQEFDIDAQIIDPSDYSVGLVGESNSQSDTRVLAALGLSVAAGASELMVERETMNSLGQSAPRLTLGNAALKGLSGSSQDEASRQADKYKDAEDYLIVPADSDVIVSLNKAFAEK